jgi:hypothetical protein
MVTPTPPPSAGPPPVSPVSLFVCCVDSTEIVWFVTHYVSSAFKVQTLQTLVGMCDKMTTMMNSFVSLAFREQ